MITNILTKNKQKIPQVALRDKFFGIGF